MCISIWPEHSFKDQLVMLQQESKIIYVEDESSKRHMWEEQDRILWDEKAKQDFEIKKRKLELRYKC